MPAAKISLNGYNGGMVLRRTPHAVYDTLYHLVWSPKYRRDVLQGEIQQRVQELFADIAEQYDITIEEMEVSPDHVHIFGSSHHERPTDTFVRMGPRRYNLVLPWLIEMVRYV